MGKTTRNRRFISIVVALMMIFSLSMSVIKANIARADGCIGTLTMCTFHVRASGSYADLGKCRITFSTSNPRTGVISLSSDITFKKDGKKITLPAGTTWDYSASSYKEGGKIFLDMDFEHSPASAATIANKYGLKLLSGKIHLDNSKISGVFWKIDCLESGFYFRYN